MPVDNVLWVDINYKGWRRRLNGADNYWVDPANLQYGVYNDTENDAWYLGLDPSAYQTGDNGETDLGATTPGAGVHVIKGVYLPDAEAITLGLITAPDRGKP
jgi:hypothetical protein